MDASHFTAFLEEATVPKFDSYFPPVRQLPLRPVSPLVQTHRPSGEAGLYVAAVASILNGTRAAQLVRLFGPHNIHCGEPVQKAVSSSTDSADQHVVIEQGGFGHVYLTARVLHCFPRFPNGAAVLGLRPAVTRFASTPFPWG